MNLWRKHFKTVNFLNQSFASVFFITFKVMGSVYAELHVEDVKNFEERQKSEIKARVL